MTDLADYVSSDLCGKVPTEPAGYARIMYLLICVARCLPSRPAMLEFVMVGWQRFCFFFFFFLYIFFFRGFVFCLLLFLRTLLRSLQGDDRLLCKDLFVVSCAKISVSDVSRVQMVKAEERLEYERVSFRLD